METVQLLETLEEAADVLGLLEVEGDGEAAQLGEADGGEDDADCVLCSRGVLKREVGESACTLLDELCDHVVGEAVARAVDVQFLDISEEVVLDDEFADSSGREGLRL